MKMVEIPRENYFGCVFAIAELHVLEPEAFFATVNPQAVGAVDITSGLK
jgi:hypothetical protein